MTDRRLSVLSLPVVAVLLAGLTFGLVLLGRFWGLGVYSLFLLAVPIAIAVAYLAWYRTLPYEPLRPTPVPAAAVEGEEPFVDPVEEADRLDRVSRHREPSGEAAPSETTRPPIPPGPS